MNSSKYIIYKCSVCNRETELILDGNRPDPLRCNITLNCRGKFQRVGSRSAREFFFTPLVDGLSDYIPRGTAIVPAPKQTIPNPITIFTAGGDGIVALSVLRRRVSGSNYIFSIIDKNNNTVDIESVPLSSIRPSLSVVKMVLFEISPELLISSHYTYVIPNAVQIVRGQDDSPEGKNLRFNSSNQITVYVNGIELSPSQYDRTVDNQITFTPSIFDTNNVVELFVYNDLSTTISTSKQIELEFRCLRTAVASEAALRNLSCWGNYSSVDVEGVERFILYSTDVSALNQEASYGVASIKIDSIITDTTHEIKTSEAFLLLGKEPFSFRDKELHAYLPVTELIDEQSVLSYKKSTASGLIFLTVDGSIIKQVLTPIRPRNIINSVISATSNSSTVLTGTENLQQKYIKGPV